MQAFKKARADGRTRNEEDEEDVDNVYEYVDENKYAEIVSNRQNDDWLVVKTSKYFYVVFCISTSYVGLSFRLPFLTQSQIFAMFHYYLLPCSFMKRDLLRQVTY